MRDLPNYAECHQLGPMHEIMRAHNRIIPRSLVSSMFLKLISCRASVCRLEVALTPRQERRAVPRRRPGSRVNRPGLGRRVDTATRHGRPLTAATCRRSAGLCVRLELAFTPRATSGDCCLNKSATSWPSQQRSTTTVSAGTAALTGARQSSAVNYSFCMIACHYT